MTLANGAQTVVQHGRAQSSTPVAYTDPDTGIVFDSWTIPAGTMKWGFTFPSDALTVDATEFIGVLVSNSFCVTCMMRRTYLIAFRNAPLVAAKARDGADYHLAAQ